MQSRQPRQCCLPSHDTALLVIHAGALQPFCSGAEHLIMQVHIPVPWEIGLGWDLSSKYISTLQAAIPESCRALYFTALFPHRVYTMVTPHFLLCCLTVMPFIMSCAKLELISCCCLLDAGGWDTDLCNAALRLLCKDAGFGYMWEVRMNLFFL